MDVAPAWTSRGEAGPWNPAAGEAYAHLFRPGYVHRDLYVSPTLFDEEMRHLFGGTWVYVGHESEIPKPGDFLTRTIGRRPIIFTRTPQGAVQVLINRCTHRGALVCRAKSGNTRRFTCGYHAWTYDNEGRCAGIPMRHAYGEDISMADYSLGRAAKVESYRGFVFASMTAAVPTLIEHLAGARSLLDQWLDRDDCKPVVVRNGDMQFLTHANWKTVYDNAGDGYHPPFSHESMLRVFAKRYGDVDMQYYKANFDEAALFSKDLGNGHTLLDQRPEMHADSAWKRQHPHPSREILEQSLNEQFGPERALQMLDASTGSGLNLNIFPNLLIIGNQIQILEPQAVDRTVVHWFSTTLEGAPPEINAIRMRMQEDFPSFGEVDDTAQFESCQYGLAGVPELEWVDISRHMATGVGLVDETDGLWREPISSDLHMRCYFAAWRHIMEQGAAR
jgi:phenylpropionate dioxygenase-like ring-hydroxylating dioxygenase large terminal subunit